MAGGIYNDEGTVILTDSKVYNNIALPWGDYNVGYGGGIYNDILSTLTLTNSYIYNNKALAGIYSTGGSFGGGIYNRADVTLRYCRIIGNIANNGADIYCETNNFN